MKQFPIKLINRIKQKYRNLKRRKINPKRVTHYDKFTNDEGIPPIGNYESESIPK